MNEKAIVDILIENKIGIVDGGARGELFPPFRYIDKRILRIIRFDPETDQDIVKYGEDDIVFKKALWRSEGRIKLNVAVAPSTSSVYSFNRELQKYIDPFINLRKTKEIVEVDAITIFLSGKELSEIYKSNLKNTKGNS